MEQQLISSFNFDFGNSRLHENSILESEIETDIFEGLLNLRIL